MSKHMVTPFTIAKLADDKEVSDLQPILGFGVDCYEAGMAEVLREVAEKELADHAAIKQSDTAKGYQSKVEYQFLLLKNTLTPELVKLLEEYRDNYEFFIATETADSFIAGFLHGYRYLKSNLANHHTYCPNCHHYIK